MTAENLRAFPKLLTTVEDTFMQETWNNSLGVSRLYWAAVNLTETFKTPNVKDHNCFWLSIWPWHQSFSPWSIISGLCLLTHYSVAWN